MVRPWHIIFLLASPLLVCSQTPITDSIFRLPVVNVTSSRVSIFTSGLSLQKIDSLEITENPGASLAEVISKVTPAYVRTYGTAGISTISIRGTSSNQSGILWNGLKLSTPNLGYVDLSLIQGDFFKDISILYGGTSPMYGSGMIGGSIHLNTVPEFKKNLRANIGGLYGSFNSYDIHGKAVFSNSHFFSSTALVFHDALNNFRYKNLNHESDTLANAVEAKNSFLQDLAFRINAHQYIQASLWYIYADREVAPTLTQESSEAYQINRSARTMIRWTGSYPNSKYEAKAGYLDEYLNYTDDPSNVHSRIKTKTFISAFESEFRLLNKSIFFSGTTYTLDAANVGAYASEKQQQNLSFYASWLQPFPKIQWQAAASIRYEFLTGYQVPFLFSIGMEGPIIKKLGAKVNISRNFRAPTMNERFWTPGGNPDLLPEKSWNQELGISYKAGNKTFNSESRVTGFSSIVDNWILWTPEGGGYWSVRNVQRVWARGIEAFVDCGFMIKKLKFLIDASYSYTRSTNEKKSGDLDASYKKQLIYIPLNKFSLNGTVLYHGFTTMIRANITGLIYTSSDNEESLPGYTLLDAGIGKEFKIKTQQLLVGINVNNILNKNYQVVPNRPMPGINYMITLVLQITKNYEKTD